MKNTKPVIRKAVPADFLLIGDLMVDVYAQLDGFPKPHEQPDYYMMLARVGTLTEKPGVELLISEAKCNVIAGAVVFFSDMAHYGSGGIAIKQKNAAGFRLLAVDPAFRKMGIGKELVEHCIELAREKKREQVIIHSTAAMQNAWKMYEKMNFVRSSDLDFMQGELPVYGFRLYL
jgi:GNAT superfamily N-acetyltransferase